MGSASSRRAVTATRPPRPWTQATYSAGVAPRPDLDPLVGALARAPRRAAVLDRRLVAGLDLGGERGGVAFEPDDVGGPEPEPLGAPQDGVHVARVDEPLQHRDDPERPPGDDRLDAGAPGVREVRVEHALHRLGRVNRPAHTDGAGEVEEGRGSRDSGRGARRVRSNSGGAGW